MMDFEQRKNEILRRSRQRIQARRHIRKRIIMTCVPLVLCVAALFTWILSGGMAMDSSSDSVENIPKNGAVHGQSMESIFDSNEPALDMGSLVSIRVSGSGVERTYTDAKTIQAVAQLLRFADDVPMQDGLGSTYDQAELADIEEMGYKLILTDCSDAAETYLLLGSCLVKYSNGAERVLDDARLDALQALLKLEMEVSP